MGDRDGLDLSYHVIIDHNVIAAYRVAPVESGCPGISTAGGNLFGEPLFADYAGGNFHLLAASAAIDQASPPYSEQADIDGVSRPRGAAPALGAYESA